MRRCMNSSPGRRFWVVWLWNVEDCHTLNTFTVAKMALVTFAPQMQMVGFYPPTFLFGCRKKLLNVSSYRSKYKVSVEPACLSMEESWCVRSSSCDQTVWIYSQPYTIYWSNHVTALYSPQVMLFYSVFLLMAWCGCSGRYFEYTKCCVECLNGENVALWTSTWTRNPSVILIRSKYQSSFCQDINIQ